MASSPTATLSSASSARRPGPSAPAAVIEANPIAFAWRAAPLHHALAAAVALGLGLPLVWLDLLLVRDLIAVLLGPPTETAPLLRVVLALPERLGGRVHVLAAGWQVARTEFALVALPLLVAIGGLAAACGWSAARIAFMAETRAVERLRAVAADAILTTGIAGRDDARGLATAVGEALRASEGWLAGAILIPALATGTGLLALGMAAAVRPPLAFVLVAALVAVAALRRTLIGRRERGGRMRRSEGAALEAALIDLVRRLPAVRAHGTAAQERARLAQEGRARRRLLADALASVGRTRALTIALAGVLAALLLGTLLPPADLGRVAPGPFAAALGAFAIAARAASALVRAGATLRAATPLFGRAAEAAAAIERRVGPARGAKADPGSETDPGFETVGDLSLVAASGYDPVSGERLTGADLTCAMPAHVAIVGPRGGGARVLAALVAGQLAPTAGRATLAGRDLARIDAAVRAGRIGYASGEATLVAGTLLDNLLYGCPETPTGADLEARLGEALTITGLDRVVYARGLSGVVDPERESTTAPALIEARAALREALVAEGAERLVEPFDPERYNRHAALGENILFGEPLGDAFSDERLAAHPFLQAVLEAEGLTRPLTELGLAVARSTTEIFADLPDDHPLFDAFSLFPAAQRGFFEELVARQPDARVLRRGPAGARDREGLIGLALRYSETRHRFGLIDEALERRIVSARRSFARLLPARFAGAIEFYDPRRITAAASLQDNLLFGRIAHDEAGAEARVGALLRRLLAERGLERLVYRIGLTAPVDLRTAGNALTLSAVIDGPAERATIELARCLIRRPDILVVGPRHEGRTPIDLARLKSGLAGRGLVLCLEDENAHADDAFDLTVRVERGSAAIVAGPGRAEGTPERAPPLH